MNLTESLKCGILKLQNGGAHFNVFPWNWVELVAPPFSIVRGTFRPLSIRFHVTTLSELLLLDCPNHLMGGYYVQCLRFERSDRILLG